MFNFSRGGFRRPLPGPLATGVLPAIGSAMRPLSSAAPAGADVAGAMPMTAPPQPMTAAPAPVPTGAPMVIDPALLNKRRFGGGFGGAL